MFVVSGCLLGGLAVHFVGPGIFDTLGFRPGQPDRLDGLTWVTSFFLHDSLWYLLGNVLLFLTMCSEVEEDLGPVGYGALLAAAFTAGNVVTSKFVGPGDLVFFDNTWDSNGDGKMNDPLTHVGIVERQDRDGTITFISRVAGAVERYRMNLGLPHVRRAADGTILNDHLRRKDTGVADRAGYLTGELFAGFGTRAGL